MRNLIVPFTLFVLAAATGCDDTRAVDDPGVCRELPDGPLHPTSFTDGLEGSEDIAISGDGTFAARKGDAIVKVSRAAGEEGDTEEIVSSFPGSAGMRFMSDGSLAIAVFDENRVAKLSPDGTSEDLVTDIGGPNGIWVDHDDRVWITATSDNKLVVYDHGTTTDVATDLNLPNGVVYDPARKVVFFDELGSGKVFRVSVGDSGDFGDKVEVATLPTSSLPDGATLDDCGNLYVISFGGRKLFRLQLDVNGELVKDPEDLVTFPGEVANPVSARSMEPTTLYVTGAPGEVFKVDVGMDTGNDTP
jgi:sugar lactone lactonase YvrE